MACRENTQKVCWTLCSTMVDLSDDVLFKTRKKLRTLLTMTFLKKLTRFGVPKHVTCSNITVTWKAKPQMGIISWFPLQFVDPRGGCSFFPCNWICFNMWTKNTHDAGNLVISEHQTPNNLQTREARNSISSVLKGQTLKKIKIKIKIWNRTGKMNVLVETGEWACCNNPSGVETGRAGRLCHTIHVLADVLEANKREKNGYDN